ncbi:MAG TPA: homocysteine S-methyltransferase family protein [Lysobacter sp.]
MPRHRTALPQLQRPFLTDGGIETTLIFHDGWDLPHFAAFHLLRTPQGREALRGYFRTYVDLAAGFGVGLVLESATWRANRDWGERLGYTDAELAQANRDAIALLVALRDEAAPAPIVISGCIGPRGDGYVPDTAMSAQQAHDYHRAQAQTFAGTEADLVTAITMNTIEEAQGVARAAREAGMPVVLSFTVETDGRLPTGDTLQAAIERVDEDTGGYPAYYMINCAHPTHFAQVLDDDAPWVRRIRGVRANASRMSHAELNEATELDAGDPDELAREHAELKRRLPALTVFGGCCGTDHRHVGAIARECLPLFAAPA